MTTKLRAFLAHPKDTDDPTIEVLKHAATGLLLAQIKAHHGGLTPEVVTGRDDFNDRAMACGGWGPWAESVATGTGYIDGALRTLYDLIIVTPYQLVGRATAQMLEAALGNANPSLRKPVFFMPHPEAPDGGYLYPVTSLAVHDPRNFKASHTLIFLQPI